MPCLCVSLCTVPWPDICQDVRPCGAPGPICHHDGIHHEGEHPMQDKRIIAGLAGLAIAGIGIAGCQSAHSAAPVSPAASTSAPAVVAAQSSAPATTAPAAPAMSTAEQQAVDSAQSYLAMGQG